MKTRAANSSLMNRPGAAVSAWIVLFLLFTRAATAALVITNISVVNVTPSSFSVVWATSPGVTPSIVVFSDSGGVSNLAGTVGIEFYPLHTGSPTLTNSYDRRANQAVIRQKIISQGLAYVRVSQCAPATTYYYRLQVANTNGQQTVSPASGPLPSVTTATETTFVIQSQQLLVSLPGIDPSGSIVIVSNSNTPSLLAAVAGDGAPSNEVYFSTSDLLAAAGNTNYLPLGSQTFVATVLGTSSNTVAQSYALNFTTDFLVGSASQFALGNYAALTIGSTILRAGDTVSIPVGLYASGVTNLNFVLNLPASRFSSLFVQGLSAQLASATLQPIGSGNYRLTFAAASGQTFQGNQQLAQLNLTTVSNQTSAIVPLSPQSLVALNSDGSTAANLAVQAGRVVIVAGQPLLEPTIAPDHSRNLTLYGVPGDTYQLQYKSNLNPSASWNNWLLVPLTNFFATFAATNNSQGTVFYEAFQSVSSGPILQAGAGNLLSLFGTPGQAYEIDYATSLSSPISWRLMERVPMTGSFLQFARLNLTNFSVFYRANVLNADPPALDALQGNQGRSLVLYGLAGTNYTLQYTTKLSPTVAWLPALSYTLTNSFQIVTNLLATNQAIFYRIKKP